MIEETELSDREFLVEIGMNIKALRLRRRVTSLQLAHRCNLDKLTISNIELGRSAAHVTTLRKIAIALDVNVARLLTFNHDF